MNSQETWKEIPGWEGYYSASTYGRIRSEERIIVRDKTGIKEKRKSFILKPWVAKSAGNYFIVGLCKGLNNRSKLPIHRLIAWTFMGPQEKGVDVRHLDGNCQNNNLSNLCYGTRKENLNDSRIHGTIYFKTNKLTEHDVLEICKMGQQKISAKTIGERFGINRNTVTEILRGEIWKHITKDLTPISNLHYQFHLLTDEQKNIILDKSKGPTEIGKILGKNRKVIERWRKKLTQAMIL